MALFTTDEFLAYLQIPAADADTVTLLHDLVEAEIDDILGDAAPTATQLVRIKGVALEATARAFRNPLGVESDQIGQVATRYGSSSTGVWLTSAEADRVRSILGTASRRSVELRPTWGVRRS